CSGYADPGPYQVRVLLAYEQGARREATGEPFPSTSLTPYPIDRSGPYSIIAVPLSVVEGPLGFVLFEIGPRIGWVYEAMQEQISSGLRGVLFVQRERRARAAGEDGRHRLELAHAGLEQRAGDRTRERAAADRVLVEDAGGGRRA